MAKPTQKSSKKEVKSHKPAAKVAAPKKELKPAPKKGGDKKQHEKVQVKSPAAKPIHKTPGKSVPPKAQIAHKKEAAKIAGKPMPKPLAKSSDKGVAKSPLKHEPKKSDTKKVEVKKHEPAKIEIKKGEAKKGEQKESVDSKKGGMPKTAAPELAKKAKDIKDHKDVKTSTAEAAVAKTAKAAPTKKKTPGKKEEFEIEDDLVGEGDFGSDELSEYQADLENAEEEVEEKEISTEEVAAVQAAPATKEAGDDVILTDAEGRRYCRVKDCDQIATVDGYCRYHYLLLWKKIQVRKKILADGKLERYVEELTSRYPDKFLEVIRRDLRTEKDFVSAIQEMEIDESASETDFEDESSNFIDEVRGATPEGIVEDDEY